MIIEEMQKRPFVRPLFVWITGILLQSLMDCRIASLGLLSIFSLWIFFSYLPAVRKSHGRYETRWVWGFVFLSLLFFLSVQRTGWEQKHVFDRTEVTWYSRLAKQQQTRFLKNFDDLKVSEKEKSVLATITLGYREGMDRDVRKRFSTTGVAHLLAVSGFHVAIVCGFLTLLFMCFPKRRFFRWLRYVLTIGLLWCFVAITGWAASAVRAGLMLTLFLTGNALRRMTDGYNTLAAAAFCMLVFNPFYLFDIGFQLSYQAVLSILYLQPRLTSLVEIRNPLLKVPWECITVTLAAQAGTALLCMYYFGQFSLVFLFTNLPLTLIATFLIPSGLVWMLLPSGFPGYALLQQFVEKLIHALLWVVEAFSLVPGAAFSFRINGISVILGYGAILFLLLYGRTKRPRLLLAALLLLLLILFDLLIERFFAV